MNANRVCRAAVIGLGYWGPNLLRNFVNSERWEVGWIIDADERRLARMQRLYPRCRASTDLEPVLEDPDLDLVAIAVPPALHRAIAQRVIAAGKHVLVEKPLAESSADARAVLNAATEAGVKVFTDHTFLYTGPVEAMQRMRQEAELGEIYYAESQRVNLGLFQQSNVIWDLAAHDVSILNYVLGATPDKVACHARACINPDVWDVAFLHLRYGDCVAQVHLSWLSPVKVRRLILSASSRMVLWDDVDPSEKLRVYDKGVVLHPSSETLTKQMVSYRLGEVRIPMIDEREALGKLIDELWQSITGEKAARVEGEFGYDVVRCLEAACRSASSNGRWIDLDSVGSDGAEAVGAMIGAIAVDCA
jgi:predicted dehydrogenase